MMSSLYNLFKKSMHLKCVLLDFLSKLPKRAYCAIIHYNNLLSICQASENVYAVLFLAFFTAFVTMHKSIFRILYNSQIFTAVYGVNPLFSLFNSQLFFIFLCVKSQQITDLTKRLHSPHDLSLINKQIPETVCCDRFGDVSYTRIILCSGDSLVRTFLVAWHIDVSLKV